MWSRFASRSSGYGRFAISSFSASADRHPHALVLTSCADSAARCAITAALQCTARLQGCVDVLVASERAAHLAATAARWHGVRRVYAAEGRPLAECVASTAADLTRNYSCIIAPANTFGKDVLPRLGGVLQRECVSEIVHVGEQTPDGALFTHPIYAGNALAKVHVANALRLVTVRTTAFVPVLDRDRDSAPAQIEHLALTPAQHTHWVRHETTKSERPDLSTADTVVAGGRALKTPQHFAMLERLADALGGALGATRAAVDAGLCPNDMQIGQTGKVVAPSLYIGVGISGAIQHLAGIKDSKVIVAINKDPEAPIFQVADYGIVGDLFEVVPELTQHLARAGTGK